MAITAQDLKVFQMMLAAEPCLVTEPRDYMIARHDASAQGDDSLAQATLSTDGMTLFTFCTNA
jgi:hypothetical protein